MEWNPIVILKAFPQGRLLPDFMEKIKPQNKTIFRWKIRGPFETVSNISSRISAASSSWSCEGLVTIPMEMLLF